MVQKHDFKSGFWNRKKNFIVRVGGWTVDRKGLLIFLNFKYVDTKVMKLLNIGEKFVTNFLMGLKI